MLVGDSRSSLSDVEPKEEETVISVAQSWTRPSEKTIQIQDK